MEDTNISRLLDSSQPSVNDVGVKSFMGKFQVLVNVHEILHTAY